MEGMKKLRIPIIEPHARFENMLLAYWRRLAGRYASQQESSYFLLLFLRKFRQLPPYDTLHRIRHDFGTAIARKVTVLMLDIMPDFMNIRRCKHCRGRAAQSNLLPKETITFS